MVRFAVDGLLFDELDAVIPFDPVATIRFPDSLYTY